jgi:hypothetical protein
MYSDLDYNGTMVTVTSENVTNPNPDYHMKETSDEMEQNLGSLLLIFFRMMKNSDFQIRFPDNIYYTIKGSLEKENVECQ